MANVASGSTVLSTPLVADNVQTRISSFVKAQWSDPVLASLLALGLTVTALAVANEFLRSFFSGSSERSWMFLGLGYPIWYMWRSGCDWLLRIFQRNFYVRVLVRRMDSPMLYDAFQTHLVKASQKEASDFVSRDCEASTRYDNSYGKRKMQFSYWGVHKRSVKLCLQDLRSPALPPHASSFSSEVLKRTIVVENETGDNVLCGRDAHLERDKSLVFWMPTSKTSVADAKSCLAAWCEACLDAALETPSDPGSFTLLLFYSFTL